MFLRPDEYKLIKRVKLKLEKAHHKFQSLFTTYTALLLLVEIKMAASQCPKYWTKNPHSGTCLRAYNASKNWYEARLLCKRVHGDLIKILSSDENQFVQDFLASSSIGEGANFFLGLRRKNNSFYWLEDAVKAPYTSWGPNEPKVLTDIADCVKMDIQNHLMWTAVNCMSNTKVICERFAGTEECKIKEQGLVCPQTCSPHCKGNEQDTTCERRNGACFLGCHAGYEGSACVDRCGYMRYGPDCEKHCSVNCFGFHNPCNHENGSCISGCVHGYLGERCENVSESQSVIAHVEQHTWIKIIPLASFCVLGVLFTLLICYVHIKKSNSEDNGDRTKSHTSRQKSEVHNAKHRKNINPSGDKLPDSHEDSSMESSKSSSNYHYIFCPDDEHTSKDIDGVRLTEHILYSQIDTADSLMFVNN